MGLFDEAAAIYIEGHARHLGLPPSAVEQAYLADYPPFRAAVEHVVMATRQAMARELNKALDDMVGAAAKTAEEMDGQCHNRLTFDPDSKITTVACSEHGFLGAVGDAGSAPGILGIWHTHLKEVYG